MLLGSRSRGLVSVGDNLDAVFDDLPRLLDPDQVADLLGKSKAAVYGWLRTGTIPGYKLGSGWVIVAADLKEYIRAGANQAAGGGEEREEL